MKGFDDLKKLEFGTVIYDTYIAFTGEKGIVGPLEEINGVPTITVIWESSGSITYDAYDDDYNYVRVLNEGRVGRSLLMWFEQVDGGYDTRKIKVTIETEE